MSLATKLIQVIWDKPKELDVFKAHIWNWGSGEVVKSER